MARRMSNRERIQRLAEEAAARAKERAEKRKQASSRGATKSQKKVRMCAVWGVFNNSYRLISSFPYNSRADAEAKAEELTKNRNVAHFVELVKKPMK